MPGSRATPLPEEDLDHVLRYTDDVWDALRGARFFVTGGTGFVGRWMLESLLHADRTFGLGVHASVLTRDAGRAAAECPHLGAHPAVTFLEGHVDTFACPEGEWSHVLHLATETDLDTSPTASFETAVDGTRHLLRLCRERGARSLLCTSSGAVYGPQPPDCARVPETYGGAPAPEDVGASYGHGKRAEEFLCAAAARDGLTVKIARCFAFVGPLLPLDAGFAVGNFIGDALAGRDIVVQGDGTARRSYLYAADLAVWLWRILADGRDSRPYNVGSDQDLSIAELAALVAETLATDALVRVAGAADAGTAAARYVPDVSRARDELGLIPRVDLRDALGRTAAWLRLSEH